LESETTRDSRRPKIGIDQKNSLVDVHCHRDGQVYRGQGLAFSMICARDPEGSLPTLAKRLKHVGAQGSIDISQRALRLSDNDAMTFQQ
jgi:hypothetical protein